MRARVSGATAARGHACDLLIALLRTARGTRDPRRAARASFRRAVDLTRHGNHGDHGDRGQLRASRELRFTAPIYGEREVRPEGSRKCAYESLTLSRSVESRDPVRGIGEKEKSIYGFEAAVISTSLRSENGAINSVLCVYLRDNGNADSDADS